MNSDRYCAMVRGYAERHDYLTFTDPGAAWMALPESDLRELANVHPDRAELMVELDSDEVAGLIATRDFGELDRIFMRAVQTYLLPRFCDDVYDEAERVREAVYA